jgi:heptosyltransferase I
MICPGSAWRNKQMAPDALLDFLQRLQKYAACSYLFIWGNQEERLLALQLHAYFMERSVVVEKCSIPALQNLMGQVDFIIAMDSLPLHLAGTTSTPSFSVFGASSAMKYKPIGDRHQSYQGSCPYDSTFEKRCPALRTCITGACIRGLKGSALFDAFQEQCRNALPKQH